MKSIVSFFICVGIIGCSGTQNAQNTSDNPQCQTIVEGLYRSKARYERKVPALILRKSSYETEQIHGKIISITGEGITFDQDRVGPFFDPDVKFYKTQEVVCAIDSARHVVFGDLPEKHAVIWDMDIIVQKVNDSIAKPLKLELTSGERFSFCMPPGQYEAKEIFFNHGEDIDEGVLIPKFTLNLRPQKVNYVGDLLLDMDSIQIPEGYPIPYKMNHRKMQGLAGAMVGLIGGISEALATEYGVLGSHSLRVVNDEQYKSMMPLPLESSIAKLEANAVLTQSSSKK
jgi:hypothetical protein